MKTLAIANTDLTVSRLSYGCMRIAGAWDPKQVTPEKRAAAKLAIQAALDAGYTLFDHADIYAQGECEAIFGEFLAENPGVRNQIVIATKCGIRFPGDPNPNSPHRFDFTKEHIVRSCIESLRRLKVETIDIYQLHRPDALMNPAEIQEAFHFLHQSGKVRYFGVSNFLPSTVAALQSGVEFPLIVNQVEIHLGRLDPYYDGTLDQCLERKMLPLAWSPLGGGWLGANRGAPADHPRHHVLQETADLLDKIALNHGVSRPVIALAWLMKHPTQIVPIVGSANPANIKDCARADEIELDREDWYRLFVAARGEALP